MKIKQNLCSDGEKLRNDFQSMTFDQPMLERKAITQDYFWHKQHCPYCDLAWREIAE